MKRPSYRAALFWLAANDDCDWLEDKESGSISVAAGDERLIKDLRVEVTRQRAERICQMNQGLSPPARRCQGLTPPR